MMRDNKDCTLSPVACFPANDAIGSLVVAYTDGSCRRNNKQSTTTSPAGWGYVILSTTDTMRTQIAKAKYTNKQMMSIGEEGKHMSKPTAIMLQTSELALITERFGPVILDKGSSYYLGSDVATNNTGELSAIGEFLLYLRDEADDATLSKNIIIRYDSEYAAKTILGMWKPVKNTALIATIKTILREVMQRRRTLLCAGHKTKSRTLFQFVHVKGHSHDIWNDLADKLAKKGANGECSHIDRIQTLVTNNPANNGDEVPIQHSDIDSDTETVLMDEITDNTSYLPETNSVSSPVPAKEVTTRILRSNSNNSKTRPNYVGKANKKGTSPTIKKVYTTAPHVSTIPPPTSTDNNDEAYRMSMLKLDRKLLLDMAPEEFGEFLTGGIASQRTIPYNMVKQCRKVHMQYLEKLKKEPDNVQLWLKDRLLSIIMYCPTNESVMQGVGSKRNKAIRSAMQASVKLLLADDWSQFYVGQYRNKAVRFKTGMITQNQDEYDTMVAQAKFAKHYAKVTLAVKEHELRKAMGCLQSGPDIFKKPDQFMEEKLRSKFPVKQEASTISAAEQTELNNFKTVDRFEFEVSDLMTRSKIVTNKLRAPGISQFRGEHLAQLLEVSKAEQCIKAAEYAELFTWKLERIANGEVPDAICASYSDIHLLAMDKPPDDVRPIGLNDLERKIVSELMIKRHKDEVEILFGKVQLAMKKSGMEGIIHNFRAATDFMQHLDKLFADGKNAFNSSSRDRMLLEVARKFPLMFPFVQKMYAKGSAAWSSGVDQSTIKILIEEGVTQGDVLGVFLYCLTILPFLEGLDEVLNKGNSGKGPSKKGEARTMAYVDDLNAMAKHKAMVRGIKYIIREGPKYGYILNPKKTILLLGRCKTAEDAIKRKQWIITHFGLSDGNVRIHPFNGGENEKYGAKLLGSYIGTDAYIALQLQTVLLPLEEVAQRMISYPDNHCKYSLLVHSYQMKIQHLLRTIAPSLMSSICADFDKLKRKVLVSILLLSVSDEYLLDNFIWESCQLKPSDGGIGMIQSGQISPAAFITSHQAVLDMLPEYAQLALMTEEESNIRFVYEFHSAAAIMNEALTSAGSTELSGKQFLNLQPANNQSTQKYLSDIVYNNNAIVFQKKLLLQDKNTIAWFLSKSDKIAAMWLMSSPNKSELYLNPEEFAVAMRRWLRIPQSHLIPKGMKCNCRNKSLCDSFGDHLTTTCTKDGFVIKTHNNLSSCLVGIIKAAGKRTKLEEHAAFVEADPESLKRPDITVEEVSFPMVGQQQQNTILMDVNVTQPTKKDSKLSLAQATKINRALDISISIKNKKYVELSTLCGLNFLPAVFESTGRMSPDLLRFLSFLSEAAEPEWKINKGIILQYWLKLISCNLQRSLSDSLLRRTAIIKGTFGSHSMSNYLQDSREEIIAIARGHGLPISAVTACNTSSVFAAGIISNSRYRTKRSAECHSFDNI